MNKYGGWGAGLARGQRALGVGIREQVGSEPPAGKVGVSVRVPRAAREDAGRTGPGAPLPQGQKREKVAAIGNFKCPKWQGLGLQAGTTHRRSAKGD